MVLERSLEVIMSAYFHKIVKPFGFSYFLAAMFSFGGIVNLIFCIVLSVWLKYRISCVVLIKKNYVFPASIRDTFMNLLNRLLEVCE